MLLALFNALNVLKYKRVNESLLFKLVQLKMQ